MSTVLEKQIQQLSAKFLTIENFIKDFPKSKDDLNNIKIQIACLSGKIQTNEMRIKDLKTNVQALREVLNNLTLDLDKKHDSSKNEIHDINQIINDLKTNLHNVHVQLTENDGQTNQCYIWLEKLQKRINAIHPIIPDINSTQTINTINNTQVIPTSSSSSEIQQIQSQQNFFKSIIKKFLMTLLISIGLAILSYIGFHFKKVIIQSMYNDVHNCQAQQTLSVEKK